LCRRTQHTQWHFPTQNEVEDPEAAARKTPAKEDVDSENEGFNADFEEDDEERVPTEKSPFNKPNRRKIQRMLKSMQKVERAVYPVGGDRPSPKGFYVLSNPWRPNEGGANLKGESYICKEPQLLVLGNSAEDEMFIQNYVCPENASHMYFHDPDKLVKALMKDSDPEDGNKAAPKA
jgi:hypothetical protein